MKLLFRSLERDGSGKMTLLPEEPEDLWHAYHLISAGDVLRASTIRYLESAILMFYRKVKSETSTGSVDSEKVRTNLSIEVVSVEFDVGGNMLRINGKNVEENPFVKVTIDTCWE